MEKFFNPNEVPEEKEGERQPDSQIIEKFSKHLEKKIARGDYEMQETQKENSEVIDLRDAQQNELIKPKEQKEPLDVENLRTISNAEFLKRGAENKLDEDSEKYLLSQDQLASDYLTLHNKYVKLVEQYQQNLRQPDSIKEEKILTTDMISAEKTIEQREKEMFLISKEIDETKNKYIKIFDKLTNETKEKYLFGMDVQTEDTQKEMKTEFASGEPKAKEQEEPREQGKEMKESMSPKEENEKELTDSEKLKQKEKIQKSQEKRYGFKNPELKKSLAKGSIDLIGSIFGARVAWEIPKLVSDIYKKRKAENATSDLLESVIENNKTRGKEKKTQELEGENKPVREKIASFEEKLGKIKLPEKEKKELRAQMAKVLFEHRHSTKNIDKQRAEKVGKVFDVYASNSAQLMTVGKEVINAVSIFAMMPWLRGVGYTALSGVIDPVMKAANSYDKKHFNDKEKVGLGEKLSFIAKAITIDSAKETYNGLLGNFFNKNEKGEKMGFGKALLGSAFKTISVGGGLMRLAGVAEFEHALSGNLVMKEGAEKFMEALKGGQIGEALKQGGENWIYNAQRLLSFVHLSNNPDKTMSGLVKGAAVESQTTTAPNIQNTEVPVSTEANVPQTAPIIGQNISQTVPIGAGTNISNPESLNNVSEKVKELATIHKGEGVIHAFQRQIEYNPQAFGYKGDIHDTVALHKFAQTEGYKIAIEDKYVDLNKGTEIRVFDTKVPQMYILNPDHTVSEVFDPSGSHQYIQNMREITKKALDETNKTAEHVVMATGTNVSSEEVNDRIEEIYNYKWGPFHGNQIEEWQTVKNLKATDVLSNQFGAPVGHTIDAAELHNRKEMMDYIKELQDKSHLPIKNNETVEQFIKRANKINYIPPEPGEVNEEIQKAVRKTAKIAKHTSESAGTSTSIQHEINNPAVHHDTTENVVTKNPAESISSSYSSETAIDTKSHLEKITLKDTTLRFSYGKSGEVNQVFFQGFLGPAAYVERHSYLKDGWRALVIDNNNKFPASLAIGDVDKSLCQIYVFKNGLAKLISEGKENTQEAILLKNRLTGTIGYLDKQYGIGKFFKPLPEILKIKSK